MKAADLLVYFSQAGKRVHTIGSLEAGVIIALDMEGRLFTVLQGEVLNRVNPAAILGESTQNHYLNPGGDGLWPAPEGTTAGYQYATGSWRVPPGLRTARYQVGSSSPGRAAVQAEVDLVNSRGLGIPTLFRRDIAIAGGNDGINVQVTESITYRGSRPLLFQDGVLAPWTLCQFNCGPGSEVVFPCGRRSFAWDLYEKPNNGILEWDGSLCRAKTDGSARYQIATGSEVPWLEYRDPRHGLTVRRSAAPILPGQSYIDIRDAAPDQPPTEHGVRYSVYSDTDHFMEIEAAGGCPARLEPGTELKLEVNTQFQKQAKTKWNSL